MLGASLRRRGVELLGRVENLEAAAESGSTAGIPLLHPWANRLAGLEYRAAGRDVRLDGASPILHFDSKGLPCKEVQLHNEAQGRKGGGKLNLCKVEGKWRVLSASQLKK